MGEISMKMTVFVAMVVVLLVGCKEKKEISSIVERSNKETVSVWLDGKEVSEQRKDIEEKFKKAICDYFECESKELEFDIIIALGTELLTVDVKWKDTWYTMTGEIAKREVSITCCKIIVKEK